MKRNFQRGQYVYIKRFSKKKFAYSFQGENTCRSSVLQARICIQRFMVPPTCRSMHGSHSVVWAILYHPFTKAPFVNFCSIGVVGILKKKCLPIKLAENEESNVMIHK